MRRAHLLYLILILLATLNFGLVRAAPQPNILWITIEDTSPQFIGAYGNSDAHTPNIDRLAQEGVRFTNAFSTGTVCSPSRSTIITGVRTYELGTGHHRSQFPIPANIKGFPYYLRQAGYYTSNNSKTDYNIANGAAFNKEAWNANSSEAGWWGRRPGQPFFSVFNYEDSHQFRTMVWPYDQYVSDVLAQLGPGETIDDRGFAMPPFYRDSAAMRRSFARVYNALSLVDKRIGQLLERLRTDNLLDSTIIFFFADHGEAMPRGKTNGIGLGYRVPFAIWFPAQYQALSPWGPIPAVTNELISFEDLAPTVLSLAGVPRPGHLKGRPFLGTDRTAPKDVLFLSSDRADSGIDFVRSATDGRYLYSRNFMPFIPELRYTVDSVENSDIMKLIRGDFASGLLTPVQARALQTRPAEFLFDLANDPWELNNLAFSGSHSAVVTRLRDAVNSNLVSSRDVLLLPEYELGQIARLTAPYDYRLDNTKFPIGAIQAAAKISGRRSARYTQQQIGWLSSSNKIVRYWAAVGLRSQSTADLSNYQTQLSKASTDSYPPAAIAAAAVSYHNFQNDLARDALMNYLRSTNGSLVLLAINFLQYSANPEPFIQVVQEIRGRWAGNYTVSSACRVFLKKNGV
ncbi:sulfatase family protein [Methylolobus aquaticus]